MEDRIVDIWVSRQILKTTELTWDYLSDLMTRSLRPRTCSWRADGNIITLIEGEKRRIRAEVHLEMVRGVSESAG